MRLLRAAASRPGHRRQGPGVLYLPVSLSAFDDAATIRAFLGYAVDGGRNAAVDGQGRLAQQLDVTSLGTLIVYNAAGVEVYRGVDPSASTVQDAFTKARGE